VRWRFRVPGITVTIVALGVVAWRHFEELFIRLQLALLAPILAREMEKEASRRVLMKTRRSFEEKADRRPDTGKGVWRFHKAYLVFGLALYGALRDEPGEGVDPVQETHRLMWESGARGLASTFAFFVRRSRDPFRVFARAMEFVNRWFFPVPLYGRVDVEVPGGVGFDYTRCPYYEFFIGEGVPELTGAFCEMDWRLAELMPSQIEMKREHTLPTGGGRCDFRYFRR
jgi:hypothetical protein